MKTPQPKFYFVCENDGAKFFHTEETAECPRCSQTLTSREKQVPPWELIELKDAARRLSISKSKLYDMCQKGQIEHHRIGGAIRFSEENLAELLEMTKQERSEPEPRKSKPRLPRLRHVRLS